MSHPDWMDENRYFGLKIECNCITMIVAIGWMAARDSPDEIRVSRVQEKAITKWNLRQEVPENETIIALEEQVKTLTQQLKETQDNLDLANQYSAHMDLLMKMDSNLVTLFRTRGDILQEALEFAIEEVRTHPKLEEALSRVETLMNSEGEPS